MKPFTGLKITVTLMLIFAFAVSVSGGAQKKEVASEEEMGLRHEPLNDEKETVPVHGEYVNAEPGKSKRIERAFENSPPLIPHDLSGMLPIAETNNMCIQCHMPERARGISATPLPRSHFFDMDTGKDLGGALDGKRYNCMQCHVPQVNIPESIRNTFKAEFRHKKDRTSSSLLESLNEGVERE